MVHHRRGAWPLARMAGLAAALLLGGLGPVRAEYPERPIRVIVPFAAGGGGDVVGRIGAACITERLGQPVVVENRPGAGGTIGTDAVTKSAPDGYTLGLLSLSSGVLNGSLYQRLPYDLRRDLVAVTEVGRVPNVVTVRRNLPVRDLAGLIAYARAQPGRVTYGSGGAGTIVHLATVLLGQRTNTELTHVPFRGAGPALNAVMADQVDLLIAELPTLIGQIRDGSIRALAVTASHRADALPEVPTTAEAGLPDFDMPNWFGFFAPAATPRGPIQRVAAAMAAAVNDPTCRNRMLPIGIEPTGSSPEAFTAFWHRELDHWGPIVRSSGAVVD
ncbi:Bug family tripartite tricarboxylate transporter substrate binding protein [Muricoccus radiodurans]|uniref:Bug family tripartite tricarboxylate transporter substrate binding protein n=1 Tax=Muricoccus radiodurans TaxID=2231721 RepID=UPI003CF5815E